MRWKIRKKDGRSGRPKRLNDGRSGRKITYQSIVLNTNSDLPVLETFAYFSQAVTRSFRSYFQKLSHKICGRRRHHQQIETCCLPEGHGVGNARPTLVAAAATSGGSRFSGLVCDDMCRGSNGSDHTVHTQLSASSSTRLCSLIGAHRPASGSLLPHELLQVLELHRATLTARSPKASLLAGRPAALPPPTPPHPLRVFR